jgi:hypothetical protein
MGYYLRWNGSVLIKFFQEIWGQTRYHFKWKKNITTTIKYLEKKKNYVRSHNVREIFYFFLIPLDGLRLTIDKE